MIERDIDGIPRSEKCEDEHGTFCLYEMTAPIDELSELELALGRDEVLFRATDAADALETDFYESVAAWPAADAATYLAAIVEPAFAAGLLSRASLERWSELVRQGPASDPRLELFVEEVNGLLDEVRAPVRQGGGAVSRALGVRPGQVRLASFDREGPCLFAVGNEHYIVTTPERLKAGLRLRLEPVVEAMAQQSGLTPEAVMGMGVPIDGFDCSFRDILEGRIEGVGRPVRLDPTAVLGVVCGRYANEIEVVAQFDGGTSVFRVAEPAATA